MAPDYALIATLPLASELPLQSASLGLYMCVGHRLCGGGGGGHRQEFLLDFCCRKVRHAIRSRDQITGLGRGSAFSASPVYGVSSFTGQGSDCPGNYGNSWPEEGGISL